MTRPANLMPKPAPETEKQFMQAVMDLARAQRWLTYHTHDSRCSTHGFPDLVMVRGERLIFAELKAARGRLSDAQKDWLAKLARVQGIEVYCWRPADFLPTGSSEIEMRLR